MSNLTILDGFHVLIRTGDVLKWGDEVEYMLVHFDDEAQRVRLSLKAEPVLKALQVKFVPNFEQCIRQVDRCPK